MESRDNEITTIRMLRPRRMDESFDRGLMIDETPNENVSWFWRNPAK
jgi:hypothetical protein